MIVKQISFEGQIVKLNAEIPKLIWKVQVERLFGLETNKTFRSVSLEIRKSSSKVCNSIMKAIGEKLFLLPVTQLFGTLQGFDHLGELIKARKLQLKNCIFVYSVFEKKT